MRPSKTNHPTHTARRAASIGGAVAGALLLAGLAPSREVLALPGASGAVQVRALHRQPAASTREDSARALHLLQRATFGARPQDLAEVLRMGREAWLDRQLHPERIDDAALQARLAAFPAAAMSPGELYAAYPPPRQDPARRAQRQAAQGDSGMMMAPADPQANRPRPRRGMAQGDSAMAMRADGAAFPSQPRRRQAGTARPRGPAAILFDAAGARLQRAVYSERQLDEVMTDFWFNHFNVFFGKNQDRYLVLAYEREAIRPHVFGRFRDLLEATARHPAMLVYLDNAQSVVPDSMNPNAGRMEAARRRFQSLTPAQRAQVLRRRGVDPQAAERMMAAGGQGAPQRRERGINENYARELMELHTLGVDGGYTQHDVVEVARALTGWTVDRGGRGAGAFEPRFVFRAAMHDPGEKTVLGHRLPAGRGEEDGEAVLDILARSPATARHVALQLAQRFVADEPPPSLVDRLAQTFTRTDGDLREVTRTLFLSPEFNDARSRGAKVKTPLEFVAGALRATGAEAGPSRGLAQALRQMGQVPYASSPPAGYPNTSAEWTNSGAMLSRMNFALALASGAIDGVRVDGRRFAPVPAAGEADAQVAALARTLMPGLDDAALFRTIADDVRQQSQPDERRRTARALGLLLGSPAFQRR